MSGCGADTEANALVESLVAGEDFTIPNIDFSGPEFQLPYDPDGALYAPVPKITLEDLTTRTIGGTAVFDGLMESFHVHLRHEQEKGRITGAEYTKAYIALTESAMNQSVAFLLGKDQAFWQAQTAQFQAMTARIEMETSKIKAAAIQLDALNTKANFALTKMKVASEEVGYCTAKYNMDNLLPQQLKNLVVQETLLTEQMEAQRGQTEDTRTDGFPVRGVMGKQKDLYGQQVVSYQRDAEVKAAKLFTDAWITMKSMDEGLLPPDSFSNASIDTVLVTLKKNNELN